MVGVETEVRSRRARRGSVAAVFATFLALTSHILGGGAMPTLMGVLVPLSLSLLICVVLAGRRLSLVRLSASVLVSQGFFHLLFSVFTPAHPPATVTTAVDRQAMAHGAMAHGPSVSTAGMGEAGSMMHSHVSAPMMLMHVIAAIVTVAVIYWVEVLPVRLGEFARLIIHAIVPVLSPLRTLPERPRLAIAVAVVGLRPLTVLRSPVLRRGPPQSAV